ncbi:MAG: N-acetyltransferase family protein [Marinibacterium sp.]
MIVRPARAGDAAAIARISNRVIAGTLITFTTALRTPDAVLADITTRGAAFQVLEMNGAVAGFATYGAFRSGPGYAATCEHSILIDPAAQGRGGGRALMTRLQDVALTDRKHVMVGAISGANEAGIRFHRALGFAEVGHMAQVGRKARRWLDLVLMQKILDAP